MSPPYTFIADLTREAKPPTDGILSRTLYDDEGLKAVLFGFGAGQELSEHTSTMPAILQFLAGEGLNEYNQAAIYSQMLRYRQYPEGLFVGSPDRLAQIRAGERVF